MSSRPSRASVPEEETWDLSHIYASSDRWWEDASHLDQDVDRLVSYRGRLHEGGNVLLGCLEVHEVLSVRLHRLTMYAYFSLAGDGSDADNQAMSSHVEARAAHVNGARAFLDTELADLPEGTIARFLDEQPGLDAYRSFLEAILARRPHLLTPDAERALAFVGEAAHLPQVVWQMVTAVDMECESAIDERGARQDVSIAAYVFGHAHSGDRTLRRSSYESLVRGLNAHKATLATTLASHIAHNVALARLRGYSSATEMILARQRVPESVYHSVLDVVHDEIRPHVARLMRLRARALGLDTLHFSDLSAPLDSGYAPATSFQESESAIVAALEPLGHDYKSIVEGAFRGRWIDRADNLGKRSGAFCWSVYGVHPYVFTTWRDTLRSTFTLAHELGHAVHYELTFRTQPQSTVSPQGMTLVVEAPSTANELWLSRHLLASTSDPRLRRWLVLQSLGTFIHNMVTHLLEGRFERQLYAMAEAGEALSLAAICEVQGEVFETFYGDQVRIDDGARLYWMQQPHFYMNLFPYTYAAGLALGYAVVSAVDEEGTPAVSRWLRMLSLGSTLPPIELAREAGVDLGDPETLRRAVRYFGSLVDELEGGIDS